MMNYSAPKFQLSPQLKKKNRIPDATHQNLCYFKQKFPTFFSVSYLIFNFLRKQPNVVSACLGETITLLICGEQVYPFLTDQSIKQSTN